MKRSPFLSAALAGCLLAAPVSGHAFKIDTHLWIGQQVINDLEDDGAITVKLRGRPVTLPVPAHVKDAILNNRNEYLLGHIGPDAVPDMLVGQTIVHPGLANGWKTNDWLGFLLAKSQGNPLGTAFSFGYLGHVAADVFSHTYVNQYAGDIFEIRDETLVEQRHVALESFISRFNPPFLNASGQNLGPSWMLVQPRDEIARFLRDALIYDGAANAQNEAGNGKHLAAYRSYRNAIASAEASPLWRNIDVAVAMFVADYFGFTITPEEAGQVIDFVNNEVIPRVQSRVNLEQSQIDRLNAAANRFEQAHFDAAASAMRRVVSVNSRIVELLAEKFRLETQVCQVVTEQICHELCCIARDPLGRCVLRAPCNCQDFSRLQCPPDAAALIQAIDAELSGRFDELMAQATQLRDQAVIARNAALDIAQRIVDLLQVANNNTSPIKALLAGWRDSLDIAMAEYVKAGMNSMINTLDPSASAMRPIIDWWDCYHRTLVGLHPLTCQIERSAATFVGALQNMVAIVQDMAAIAPDRYVITPAEVDAALNDLKARTIAKLQEAAVDELIDHLPQELQDLLTVLEEDMNEDRLRFYFTKPESGAPKGLLSIPDVDQRVKKEMSLTADGKYDPARYAVVYNSVVLAKLALLDFAGLSVLAAEAGVSNAADGAPLFAGTENVVANAFASLDGNHQWMPVAPPRPNATGAPYRRAGPGDGYPHAQGYASSAGLVLWKPEARNALFRSLFIGPLSPGIESPEEIGMSAVLPADYPYRPCAGYPFPNDEHDKTCAGLKALPAILQLLLDD